MTNILVTVYFFYAQPFKKEFYFRLEVFNELTICICGYILVIFEMIEDPDLNYLMGWVIILIVIANAAINL